MKEIGKTGRARLTCSIEPCGNGDDDDDDDDYDMMTDMEFGINCTKIIFLKHFFNLKNKKITMNLLLLKTN